MRSASLCESGNVGMKQAEKSKASTTDLLLAVALHAAGIQGRARALLIRLLMRFECRKAIDG